jgi:hypothetical protein
VNFTREPIIETIITPKDGYKLVVRNSKSGGQEEHIVDAVEVVSFGHSFFFRSLERPKPFLVPVSDYEVLEVKEARVVLKNANIERAIKIGGGREAPVRHSREPSPERTHEPAAAESDEQEESAPAHEQSMEPRSDRKRDRRRNRRRRGGDDRYEQREWSDKSRPAEDSHSKETSSTQSEETDRGGGAHDETQVSSSMFSTLFPPPQTLISETIGRYKDMAFSEGNVLPKPLEAPEDLESSAEETYEDEASEEQKHKEKKHDDEDSGNAEGSHLNRASAFPQSTFESSEHISSSTSFRMTSFNEDTYFTS